MTEKKKVLFLCWGNSARSQMAEGLMKSLGSEQWDVKSAGTFPSYVHPLAIRVMGEIEIDISQQTSKAYDQFLEERFDYLITLCEEAARTCPVFPGERERLIGLLRIPRRRLGRLMKDWRCFEG
jgi:arsenate reductase